MKNKKQIVELKEAVQAYKIALNYDYCPYEDQFEEVKQKFDISNKNVLVKYQGNRPDEIARMIVDLVEDL